MALTIALINSKGGVAKTTATIFLATAFARAGYSVEVWDADPQGSASEWLDMAAEDEAVPFAYSAANLATLSRRKSAADVLLIDTPPRANDVQDAAAARADLVLIPTATSGADMQRVWRTLDALAGAPARVLITRTKPNTINHREALEALDAEGVARLEAVVTEREVYKAMGILPRDLGAYADVLAELMTLKELNA